MADAFRAATEMFEGRVASQEPLLDAVLLPAALLLITALVGTFITAIFLPLNALIEIIS